MANLSFWIHIEGEVLLSCWWYIKNRSWQGQIRLAISASTHSLPCLLHGPYAPLHSYCRKEGTFVTPTLIVQKTLSYIKAKKFHFLALFMGRSRCTRKTTQRNHFLLESQHNSSNSTLSCNPPLPYTDDLQSKFCYLPFFTQRCVCRWKSWGGLKGTKISPNGKHVPKKLPSLTISNREEEVMDRKNSLRERPATGFFFCLC